MRKSILLLVSVLLLAACVRSTPADLLMQESYEQDMNQAAGNALLAKEIEKSKPLIDLSLDK